MKLEDVQFIVKDINKEMPLLHKEYAKIPYPTFRRFPKNLMDEANRVQNKFLNNHLGEIEEANHYKLLSKDFKNWFLHQNLKYHKKSGILNCDGFFKNIKNNLLYGHKNSLLCCGVMLGNMNTGGYRGALGGPDLESGDTSSTSTGFTGQIFCAPLDAGTIGLLYDQIAVNVNSSAGNSRLACYDDSASLPVNLYEEIGSTALSNGFNFESITEFDLVTTANWAAMQLDNAAADIFQLAAAGGQRDAQSYGVFTDPIGALSASSNQQNMKIGHT